MRISCTLDLRGLVDWHILFMPTFFLHVELDVMLTGFFSNSPILNRLRGTSRAPSRKSQNMKCVPSTVVVSS